MWILLRTILGYARKTMQIGAGEEIRVSAIGAAAAQEDRTEKRVKILSLMYSNGLNIINDSQY